MDLDKQKMNDLNRVYGTFLFRIKSGRRETKKVLKLNSDIIFDSVLSFDCVQRIHTVKRIARGDAIISIHSYNVRLKEFILKSSSLKLDSKKYIASIVYETNTCECFSLSRSQRTHANTIRTSCYLIKM